MTKPKQIGKVLWIKTKIKHEMSLWAPYYLLFGHSTTLPIDSMFSIPSTEDSVSHEEYARKWKLRMEEAHKLANKATQASGKEEKNSMTERFRVQVTEF